MRLVCLTHQASAASSAVLVQRMGSFAEKKGEEDINKTVDEERKTEQQLKTCRPPVVSRLTPL